MNVSIITTVLNEADNIERFLCSVLAQTLMPYEIIVVDGGSTDGTVDIISDLAAKHSNLKLIVIKGANRSMGRNAAIDNSLSDIIGCVDAGCYFMPDWLENLLKPLRDDCVGLAFGLCTAQTRNIFQECLSVFGAPRSEDIDANTFLPSSRSIAFRKEYWKKAGGYPEQYYKNEDTPFDIALKKVGCHFALAKEAKFLWEPRCNFQELFRQQYNYAVGDGEGRILFPVYWKTSAFYLGILLLISIILMQKMCFFLLVPLIIIIGYHFRYFYIGKKRLGKKNIFWPMLKVITGMDLGNVLGFWKGYIWSIVNRRSFCNMKDRIQDIGR